MISLLDEMITLHIHVFYIHVLQFSWESFTNDRLSINYPEQ